nr:EOG090X07NA [Cyclestheria hislopi]
MMDIGKKHDPVIKEIPIYLSKNLLEKLYVFQYPLQSVSIQQDKYRVLTAKIKPKQQQVELDVEISTKTGNYDVSKGEQIALNTDGSNRNLQRDEENYFKSSVMDKIVYTSTRAQLDPKRYAVGIMSKGELHLNPIHGIIHLRPSFQYLDKSDKIRKNELKESGVETESGDEEEQPQQVTVKFAKTESDRLKAAREKSFGFLQKRNAEEPWFNTKFNHFQSEESLLERSHLLCGKPQEEVGVLTLSKAEYLKSLIGDTEDLDEINSKLPLESVSMTHIRALPLGEQVKHIMLNVKLISFGHLCDVLKIMGDARQQLLRSVQQVAVLVQGNWVVKSDVLYPKDKLCGVTGIHHEIIIKARDYLLYHFTQNRFADRKPVTTATRIPTLEMKNILEQIAHFKRGQGWEFALPFDHSFVNKNPEVVQRQEMLWKAKQQQLQQNDFKTPKREPSDSPGKSRRQRRRSRRDSCSSDSGNENKKA